MASCNLTWLLWYMMNTLIHFHLILMRQDQKIAWVSLFQDLSKIDMFKSSIGEKIVLAYY